MHRLFCRVLLFQFPQILPHRLMHLGRFRQLLPWNPALLGRIRFHEAAIYRHLISLIAPRFRPMKNQNRCQMSYHLSANRMWASPN